MFRSIFLMVLSVAMASLVASSFLSWRVAQSKQGQSVFDLLPSAAPPRLESVQHSTAAGGFGQMEIAPDRSGNYLTEAEIDGHLIHMVVDTGATYVSLTNSDASAIGIRPAPMDYHYRTMTANGTGVAAKVRIATLRLGQMEINDVEAFVMPPGVLGTSLLGMSALSRLGKVEISGGQLVLRQ
ncbi:MAG: TIGR02281 family clan AA aspartic protease [Methylovirgula sp.]